MQIVCHGIGTGALFLIVGALQERLHTRNIQRMGGLWATIPHTGAFALLFALAALALPGLGNFIGEFLVLLGTFPVSAWLTALATLGLITATVYALWMIQHVFHGQPQEILKIPDFSAREMLAMSLLIVLLLWLGLFPQTVLNTAHQSLEHMQLTLSFTSPQAGQVNFNGQETTQELAYDIFQPGRFITLHPYRPNPPGQPGDYYSPASSPANRALEPGWIGAGFSPG